MERGRGEEEGEGYLSSLGEEDRSGEGRGERRGRPQILRGGEGRERGRRRPQLRNAEGEGEGDHSSLGEVRGKERETTPPT